MTSKISSRECVCVCERERESVCVCICVCGERESCHFVTCMYVLTTALLRGMSSPSSLHLVSPCFFLHPLSEHQTTCLQWLLPSFLPASCLPCLQTRKHRRKEKASKAKIASTIVHCTGTCRHVCLHISTTYIFRARVCRGQEEQRKPEPLQPNHRPDEPENKTTLSRRSSSSCWTTTEQKQQKGKDIRRRNTKKD